MKSVRGVTGKPCGDEGAGWPQGKQEEGTREVSKSKLHEGQAQVDVLRTLQRGIVEEGHSRR